ncbi:putative lipase 1 precursor [Phaeomoniella chlamydospora]|uniref:Putative lipase 1 n=1 Tax=Phaeomoniella chlamydospora TaxID=158046 RepID=A0A0G2EEJ3_PHACM|nr:putative lipase 1 precursor [Phaeomoniella chlamydospora]
MFVGSNLLVSALTVALLVALPTAFPYSVLEDAGRSLEPIPPSQDSFYTAPAGFEAASPGSILRLREAPGNLTSIFNFSSSAFNILYRTTNSRYQPSWAVTTVFVPLSAAADSTDDAHALLSYQIPYNSVDVDSSPSYTLYNELATGFILSDINTALGHGWYVNVPDFEGPLASFASGVQEGHATLDSVRAVLFSGVGLSSDTRYVMWGYSGGSIATEWASELQVQYAPELNFSGMAIGGLVPNMSSALHNIDATPASGLVPAALLGITNQYPDAYHYLISNLKTTGPYNATYFLNARNMSYYEDASAYANQSIFDDYFVQGASVLQHPTIQKVFNSDGLMGYHGVPQMPVFVHKAVHDEYSAVGETDALVAHYCKAGASIRYQRNLIGNHLDEYTNGDAQAFQWLQAVLNRTFALTYQSPACVVQNVSINITSHGPFES